MADEPIPVEPDTGTAKAPTHRVTRLAAEPQAPSTAGQIVVETVAATGPPALLGDAERVAAMLVAEAIGHSHAPVELTVDTHDDVIRVEVRDQGPAIPASVGSMVGHGILLWCELRDQPARPP